MNSVETTSQQLMAAIDEQRRLRRREESGSWRTQAGDFKWLPSTATGGDDEQEGCVGESLLTEPPLSLNADGERNYHLVGTSFDIPLHNVPCGTPATATTTSHKMATISNQSTPINLSPLTAASATMEKEYDRDTWRMYQRIKSARVMPTATSAVPVLSNRSSSLPHMHYFRPASSDHHEYGTEAALSSLSSRHDVAGNYASSVPNSISPLNFVSCHDDDDDEDEYDGHDEIFEMDLDS